MGGVVPSSTTGSHHAAVSNTLCLTLVRVSDQAEHDENGEELQKLWRHLAARAGCADAASTSSSMTVSIADQEMIRASMESHIFSFLKRSDQYLALASLLLKSQSFYKATEQQPTADTRQAHGTLLHRRLVRQLPRTEHGKPFIPRQSTHQQYHDYINVSHQYPFIGIVQRRVGNVPKDDDATFAVGLDIVVFDAYPPSLFASFEEFVECFKDSLTDDEWRNILYMQETASDEAALREFYLLWAVKEAYTKALGVGLGFDFGSFHVDFDANASYRDGLRETLLHSLGQSEQTPSTSPIRLQGRIVERDGITNQQESVFYFVPLCDSIEDAMRVRGCACMCVMNGCDVHPSVDWQSLQDLLVFHTGP